MQQGQHFGRVYYLRLSENRRPSPPLPPKTHPATRGSRLTPFFLRTGPGRTHGANQPVALLKWGTVPHRIALGKKLAP